MAKQKHEGDQKRNILIRVVRDTYFWQRVAITAGWTFLFYAAIWRFVDVTNPLFALAVLLLMGLFFWTFFGVFRRPKAWIEKKPMKPIWQRAIAFLAVTFLVLPLAILAGSGVALAIKPYSSAEVAEQKARAAADAKAEVVRQAAEKAKQEAEAQQAKDKAAADARAAREKSAADKAKADAEAKVAADKAAAERAQAEQSSTEANATAEQKRQLEALRQSSPLLYARRYCSEKVLVGVDLYNYLQVSDDGSTMFLSTNSGDDLIGLMTLVCVEDALSFSPSLKSSIEHTNALMGTKTWTENKLDFEWSYHPQAGLNMSILRKKECFLGWCNF